MKNKLYYVLFLVYAVVVAFILYINGVFTGEETSMVNLLINVGFLIIIGILFLMLTVAMAGIATPAMCSGIVSLCKKIFKK